MIPLKSIPGKDTAAGARPAEKRKTLASIKSERIRKSAIFLLFVLPALALYIYMVAIPFFKTFYYCFTDWNGMTDTYNFVNLENFDKLIHDGKIWQSLKHNLVFCVVGGILTFGIALFNAAVITQSKLRERQLYRIIFFFPNILSVVIVAVIWSFVFNPSFGILNAAMEFLGLGDYIRVWLGDKSTVVFALIVPWVWMSVGFYMVLFISAIEGIPASLLEAAEIDGANSVQKFFRITMPLLKETTKTALVFFFINAFSGVFTLVNVMTNGEPAGASEVLTNYMYRTAFQHNRFGYATAIGVFVFFIIILISGVTLLLTRSKERIEY